MATPERGPVSGNSLFHQLLGADAAFDGVHGLWATLETARVGIVQFDFDGRFLLANSRFCELVGYPRKDLLDRSFREIAFPADLAACEALNRRLAAGDLPGYRRDIRFRRRDSSAFWARLTVSAVRGQDGHVAFFVGVAEDVSHWLRMEAGRQEAEGRLRAALEASRTGTFRWDIRTGELDWDENLDRLCGLAPGEVRHSIDEFLDRVYHEDRAAVAIAVRRCAEQGSDFHEEFRVVWPDGSLHWFLDRGRTVLDRRGEPKEMVGACTDITDQKRAEQAVRESEAMLGRMLARERAVRLQAERATRRRDEVLGVVAHDLRNPVHTITGSASLLAGDVLDPEQRDRQVGVIQRSARAMDILIQDLLAISLMESGVFTIEKVTVDLGSLLPGAVELLEQQAAAGGVELRCEIGQGVEPVPGDPDRLNQLLSNLLGNAVKFTPAGGHVTARAVRGPRHLLVSVEDTGPGIPPDEVPRIFDRFWQAGVKRRAGAGLGLAISKAIADAHGGSLQVESTPGQGTTFSFTLPM